MVRRLILSLALLALCTANSPADDKADQAAKLKKEIAELRAKLATLEGELAKVEPRKREVVSREDLQRLNPTQLEAGMVGRFSVGQSDMAIWVDQVVSESEMVIRVGDAPRSFKVAVANYPTSGLVDDKLLDRGGGTAWKVVGTKKIDGRTMHLIEPVSVEK